MSPTAARGDQSRPVRRGGMDCIDASPLLRAMLATCARRVRAPVACRWLCPLLMLAACGARSEPVAPTAVAAAAAPAGPHRLVVFATDSLRRPCTALARRYEQDHPGSTVELRCEGGVQLLAAMHAGAEADNTPALYSISVVREAKEPRGAGAFRALALGPIGQQILIDAGFLPVGEKSR